MMQCLKNGKAIFVIIYFELQMFFSIQPLLKMYHLLENYDWK